MKAFQGFLDQVLPDPASQRRLQMFFGSFLCRGPQYPGFLVLCGDGVGAWGVYAVIAQVLGKNSVTEVPMSELAWDPEAASHALDVSCNVCFDLTSEAAYSHFFGAMRRIVVDGVLVSGSPHPAPRIVVMSLFTPDPANLPPALGRAAVVVPFTENLRASVAFSDVLGELPAIRAWAKQGLAMLEAAGGFDRVMDQVQVLTEMYVGERWAVS